MKLLRDQMFIFLVSLIQTLNAAEHTHAGTPVNKFKA